MDHFLLNAIDKLKASPMIYAIGSFLIAAVVAYILSFPFNWLAEKYLDLDGSKSSISDKKKVALKAKAKVDVKPKTFIVAGPYTAEEVAKHDKENDAWIIVDNKVYDITDFVPYHPGGDSILNNVGRDSSVGFHGPQHPPNAWDVMNERYIGNLIVASGDKKADNDS